MSAKGNATRQAEFKARWLAAGWKRKTLWVNGDEYAAGEKAARRGSSADELPANADAPSWLLGYAAARAEGSK